MLLQIILNASDKVEEREEGMRVGRVTRGDGVGGWLVSGSQDLRNSLWTEVI